MNFKASKNIAIRRFLLVLVAVISAIIQNTPGFRLSLGNLSPMLLIPFVVCVAMYERSLAGLAYGVLSGALWDFGSTGADGMYTLMLATIGFGVGMIITFYVRNRLFSAFVLTLMSSTAVSVAYWMLFVLRKGFEGTWTILLSRFLPIAIYTALFVFVYYFLIGFIIKSTGKGDKNRTYI